MINTSQMHTQCLNFSKCDNEADDNCEAALVSALVSVLSQTVKPDGHATMFNGL